MGQITDDGLHAPEMIALVDWPSRSVSNPRVLLVMLYEPDRPFHQVREAFPLGDFPGVEPLVALGLWQLRLPTRSERPRTAECGSATAIMMVLHSPPPLDQLGERFMQ